MRACAGPLSALVLAAALGGGVATAAVAGALRSPAFAPDWPGLSSASHAAACDEVSNVLGSGMVLQQAPARSAVWGTACGGLGNASSVRVTLVPTLASAAMSGTTRAAAATTYSPSPLASVVAPVVSGRWAATLPAVPGGFEEYTIVVDDGQRRTFQRNLTGVLFGEVVLCSGQSNMVFSVEQMDGAAEELALVASAEGQKYQHIRVMTVAPTSDAAELPPGSVSAVEQAWTAATAAGALQGGAFKYFSAVCWLQGRELFDSPQLRGRVPVGLVCSAFGGTRVHQWSSRAALDKCPQHYPPGTNSSSDDGAHWNGMIAPLTPLRFRYAVWLQSESDVCPSDDPDGCGAQRGGTYYSCAIQAMLVDWRARFNFTFPFIWVQIAPWEGHEAASSLYRLPEIRAAQMAVQQQPLTAVATAVDLGSNASAHGWDTGDEHGPDPWGNVHFRHKRPLGPRIAACAANLVFGNTSVVYRGPEALAATQANAAVGGRTASDSTSVAVVVSFDPHSVAGGLQFRHNRCPYQVLRDEANRTTDADCPHDIDDCIAKCGWFELRFQPSNMWVNATAAIDATHGTLVLSAAPPPGTTAGVAATGARYLYADWPVATLFNGAGFPALPFNLSVRGRGAVQE